jgi:hypothetical protein
MARRIASSPLPRLVIAAPAAPHAPAPLGGPALAGLETAALRHPGAVAGDRLAAPALPAVAVARGDAGALRARLLGVRRGFADDVVELPGRRKLLPGIPPGRLPPLPTPRPAAPPAPAGVPRAQLAAPVSPAPAPDDRTLFERPEDAAQKLYVPRYRLGEETLAGGQRRYRVELGQDASGGYLRVFLARGPAPELAAAVAAAAPVPLGAPVVRLRYNPVEDLAFDEVSEVEGGVLAVLRIAEGDVLRKLQQIAGAMQDPQLAPTLVVERDVSVAVPGAVAPEAAVVSQGAGALRGTWIFDLETGREGQPGDIWWQQQTRVLRCMTPQSGAQIADLGRADFDALSVADLQRQAFSAAPIDGSDIAPSAVLLQITPLGNPAAGPANSRQAGVWWDGGRWSIYNEDFGAMPEGAAFAVASAPPNERWAVHRAAAGNLNGHMTDIDHPLANGNPDAVLIVTHNWNPGGAGGVYNSHPFGVWYNGARWSIYNQDLQPMPDGACFNVTVLAPGQPGVIVHRAAAANTAGHLSEIDHPELNGRPDLRPLVTHSWNPGGQGGVYNNHPVGAWYNPDRGRWAVANMDGQPLPEGAAFNLFLAPSPDLHTAAAANIAGHCTFLDAARHRVNRLEAGAVFAVRTRGGDFAKVQVVEYGYNLGLRWVTYRAPAFAPGAQLYEVVALDLDQALDFSFNPATNRHIYERISGTAPGGGEWVQHRLRWARDGKTYTYYQDALRRNSLKYFPDAFKLARRDGPAHTPWVDVIYALAPDGVSTQVTMDYKALPFVNQERLLDAADQLVKKGLMDAREPVACDPMPTPATVRYLLKLPGAPAEPRAGALVHLEKGISDALTMPIEPFARLYGILAGESAVTIEGVVEVELPFPGGAQREAIPFYPRLTDLLGEQFTYEVGSGATPGTYSIQLRNATESALQIPAALPVSFARGDAQVAATVERADPPLPAELAPGATLTLTARPAAEPPGAEPLRPVLDLSGVRATFDKAATLRAITAGEVQAPYRRPIAVEAVPGTFPDGPPQDGQVTLIVVDLGPGPDVRLIPAAPSGNGAVSLPPEDYVLGRATDGAYRYALTICRQGRQPETVERTEKGDTLLVFV